MPINDHFDYVWIRRGLPNVTIPFSRRAVSIDIEKVGVTATFDSQVKNYSKWQCSEKTGLPLLPRNPEYLSFKVVFMVGFKIFCL